jgi:type VI protein secretion system component VasK
MNIKELDKHPRLWTFFASVIAVVIAVLIIATADSLLTLILRILAAMPVVPRGGEEPISRERKLIALILVMVVQTPLSFIWKACGSIPRKWKLLMSEGAHTIQATSIQADWEKVKMQLSPILSTLRMEP